MSGEGKRTSDASRRASVRMSLTARQSLSMTDDEDDYAMQAMGITDGFRPSHVAASHSAAMPGPVGPTSHPDPVAPSIRLSSPPPRPSSITKPRLNRDSFSLRHDGASSDLSNAQGPMHQGPTHRALNSSPLTRESSVSSVSPFAHPDDPYEGPSEPSHPYQMYPQNVRLARTASVATTSTAPVSERSYAGPRGPTHPYGMYLQNTASGSEGGISRSTDRTMVGFGTVDNYERRLGPEGEEAGDLIGPDGHTEQLPPYTRYPDEAYARKAMGVDSPHPVPAQPLRSIPGAGGLGLATRNPEFSSSEDLPRGGSPESRQSVQSFRSDSSHNINTAAYNAANNEKPQNNWQATARKRVWGVVPCWALALAGIVLVLLAIIMGAVIGTVLSSQMHHKPPHHGGPEDPVYTITKDSSPFPTVPPGLSPLATGPFSVPILQYSMTRDCFNESSQANSWQCAMVYSQLSVDVEHHPDWDDTRQYSLSFVNNDSFTMDRYVYSYGVQPPAMENEPLTLVRDTYEPELGPAWAMEVAYNKTVLIPEDSLHVDGDPPPGSTRRNAFLLGDPFTSRAVAKTGEKPWICYWQSTLFETFLYADQPSEAEGLSVGPHSSSPTPTTPPYARAAAAIPTGTLDERTDYSGMGGIFAQHSEYPPEDEEDDQDDKGEYSTSSNTPTTTTPPVASGTGVYSQNVSPTNPLAPYPRVMKIMERRIPSLAPSGPWCRQYQILGPEIAAEAITDDDGHYIDVQIIENDADYGVGYTKRDNLDDVFAKIRRRDGDDGSGGPDSAMSDCGCMWRLT